MKSKYDPSKKPTTPWYKDSSFLFLPIYLSIIYPICKDKQIQKRKQNDTLLPDCGLLGRPIPVRRVLGNKQPLHTRIGNHATNKQLDCLCSGNSIGSTAGAIHSQHQYAQIPQANMQGCRQNRCGKPQQCLRQQKQHYCAGIHPLRTLPSVTAKHPNRSHFLLFGCFFCIPQCSPPQKAASSFDQPRSSSQ